MSEPWFTHNTGNQPCVCPFCKQEAALRAARERIKELEKAVEHLHGMIERQDALADKGMAYERKLEDWIERAVKWIGWALQNDLTPELRSHFAALLLEREGK